MRIALIVAYYGKWPSWMPAYLQSCRYNPDVDWLIFTDLPAPKTSVPNVRFVPVSLTHLRALASDRLGFPVLLDRPYKLCDLKPAYGMILADYLRGYDFWGHCDLDIIWGDVRAFVSEAILEAFDVVSARKYNICGHFTLYRNFERLNSLFLKNPRHREVLQTPVPYFYDEVGMTKLVAQASETDGLRVYWPRFLVNFANEADMPAHGRPSRLGPIRNRWVWDRGKLYHRSGGMSEVMYLHFMTWKNSLKECMFGYDDNPQRFIVSYSHIGLTESDRPSGGLLRRLRHYVEVRCRGH